MEKYIGIKNGKIVLVSDQLVQLDGMQVIELPEELNDIDPKDIILNYKFKNNQIINKNYKKPAEELKIAFISNFGTKCGIATYSKFLYSELIPLIKDYRIFAEINASEQDDPEKNSLMFPEEKITHCWKRGESLTKLVEEVKSYDPDLILIQHEFGIFPNACHWISMLNQLSDYRIITTMHSVFEHKDKTIVEAPMKEIIVHLEGAKKVLKEQKQITGKVSVINHGCFPCVDKTKLWNYYKTKHTFIQFGFLFKYKGFENSIKTVALLKDKYPDVYFTGLCSESELIKQEHENLYQELMALVEKLGVQENVGLIRGYQSENVINSYLRTNRVALFPYMSEKEHKCYGSSGATPYAMTCAIPVISSNVPHFEGLPTIKADTPEEMATELDKLFSDYKLINNQVEIQNKYLEENSWKETAKKYLKVFCE